MSIYTILSAFFLAPTVAAPSSSGPGITARQGNSKSFASYTCEDSMGRKWSAGSTITNTNIHQMATCTGPNYWGMSVYPSNCDIRNQNYCWDYCAHNFSGECKYNCQCMNDGMGRLGAGYTEKNAKLGASDDENAKLGGGLKCPVWLPQAIDQLTHGAKFVCYYPGQFCKYPAYGMNFLCGRSYMWNKLGHGPAPSPPPSGCPRWSYYMTGDYCTTNGILCEYPQHGRNYICQNNQWDLQTPPGPPVPSPTPAPANPANCPLASFPPSNNGFCAVPNLTCRYSTGNFECNNGRWKKLYL